MSFVESRPVVLCFFAIPSKLELSPSTVFLVLLINRNIQDINFIMNGVIYILFFLLKYKLLEIFRLAALQLPQSILHSIILLTYFVDHFQQLLYLKCLI